MTSMPPPPDEETRGDVWAGSGPPPGEREGKRAFGWGIAGVIFGPVAFVALHYANKGQRLADEAGIEAPAKVRTGKTLAWVGLGIWAWWIVVSIATSVTG